MKDGVLDSAAYAPWAKGRQPTSSLQRAAHEMFGVVVGGGSGTAIGSAIAGPLGATVGAGMGGAMGKALQAARDAGIRNTDHLVNQALLDPTLMRVLLAKATPQNQASLMGTLASRLRQVSLVSAVQAGNRQDQGQPDLGRPAGEGFVVRQNDLTPVARPGAASYGAAAPTNALRR